MSKIINEHVQTCAFASGPDRIEARLYRRIEGGEPTIYFDGEGPRGGHVYGPKMLDRGAMIVLRDLINKALGE